MKDEEHASKAWRRIEIKPVCCLAAVLVGLNAGECQAEGPGTYSYFSKGGEYHYKVTETGANFSFEFERNPGPQSEKLKAAVNVMTSVYDEDTVVHRPDGFFMKETAKCFVFDGSWHTYTACFLPNEYSPGNQDRFWGFVYRVPNAWWLVTRNLVPAFALLGTAGFFLFRRSA